SMTPHCEAKGCLGNPGRFRLLSVCESIGDIVEQSSAKRLLSLSENFRTPIAIRRQAMRVFGKVTEPTTESVAIFVRLLKRNDIRLNEATYAAAASFVTQCRRRVDYVRRVYGQLGQLRSQLTDAWKREIDRATESIDPRGPRDIRRAIVEIESLIAAYEEFSERATLTT
ncbi:MAG TPA: hypothetical protein PLN31_18920, partial [Azoarcus taiwanensis]|nr:hypothetical protein [Azoarcus taiwanensis]